MTGVVEFKSAGHRDEERQVGRRVLRVGLPQYSLGVRLLLLDGKTGQRIASAVCGPIIAHATASRERALHLYFRLIDRMMPSMLAVFGRRTVFRSGSAPACRPEEDDGVQGPFGFVVAIETSVHCNRSVEDR